MAEISAEEIEKAYSLFRWNADIPRDVEHSLKAARLACQLSMSMVAEKIGISKSSYCQLEKAEARQTVSVRQLRRVAEAMDCELVFYFKPRNGNSFSRVLWTRLLPYALKHPGMKSRLSGAFAQCLAAVVHKDCFPNPEIRRRLGWARKKYVQWPRYWRWDRRRWPFTVSKED